MQGDQQRDTDTRLRDPSCPKVRIPIPAQKSFNSGSLPGRSKKEQHKKLEHDVSMRLHYSRQPSEERQAASSPMGRETFLPTRSYDVSERRDAVESLPSYYEQHELANQYHKYTPQQRGGNQNRSNPKSHHRVSTIPRPHDYRASSQVHLPLSSHNDSSHEHSNQGNRRQSSSSRDMDLTNRNTEMEVHRQQQQDGYSDDGSKKSKKSLLSRASRKLKKKMIKEENNHVLPPEGEIRYDEGSHYTREARDPSPTMGTNSRYQNNNGVKEISLPEGDWVYSGKSPNQAAYQGLIQAFPSLGEFSSGSTISTAFTNQLDGVVLSPRMSQIKPKAVQKQPEEVTLSSNHRSRSTPLTSATSKASSLNASAQNDSTSLENKQHAEQARSNAKMSESDVNGLRNQLARQEKLMESETKKLIEELRKQKNQFEAMQGDANTKINQYTNQVESDLEAYKSECSVYRERLLQMETDNAKMEQALRNERKKVLSLEEENEMLIKAAEEKVGDVMTMEQAKSSELKSYMDQCEKYRERVLGLERKVMSMESALNATSSITATLEEEKETMISELSQAKANMATFKSEISDKDAKIGSLQSDIANLQSASSKLEASLKDVESKANDDNQSIVMLENENASLLVQLKEKTLMVDNFEASTAKYRQIEDENASLKRKNDELTAKELQMKEELSKSEVFSSNTERLRKMLSDSESYITSLQNDLSSARTSHHQQLTDARAKYSSEIDCLTTKWEIEKAAKRELEIKNNNLEEKVLSLEYKLSEIVDQGTHQSKSQSDQLLKMMEHADGLRKKLYESSDEMSVMKQKLDSKEQTVAQLRSEIQSLEEEKSKMADNVHALEGELHDFTTEKTNQIKELQHYIKERDDAVAKQESISASATTEKQQQIKELNATLEDTKKNLEAADEENNLLRYQLSNSKKQLRKQASDMKQQITETMNNLRVEQTTLKSDVHSSIQAEKAFLEKKVKEMAFDCRRKLESDQLNKEMVHQASMSSLHSQMKGIEQLLIEERKKTHQLESKLEEVQSQKKVAESTIEDACSKLGLEIRQIYLADAIDDLMLERTQAESKIVTLNIDIKTLKSTIDSLEYDKNQLSDQMRLLSERKGKEINELKRAFDSDRKAQDASIDSLIASKEEELQALRTTNDELKEKIEKLSEEAAHLQRRSERCEAELKECQEELSAAKEDSRCLNDKLSEATRDYQAKADNLTEHYMKIEDELRIQLNSTRREKEQAEKRIEDELNTSRQEKDTAEKKLVAQKKETDRLMDEFYSQKEELTSRVMELTDRLDAISNDRDVLQRQEGALKSTIAAKEREAEELQESVVSMKDQLQRAQNEARQHDEMSEMAKQQVLELREVISQYSKDLDSAKNELEDSRRICESERSSHAKEMSKQQSSYEYELERVLLSLETLTFEKNSLEESLARLKSRISQMEKTKSKQADQILQLKTSLNEALGEALRLGSKIDADEMRHLEITQTLSLFQEENSDLKQSLTGVEHDQSSFNERLGKLSLEKDNLQQELSAKEVQLYEALKSLTHFELKLAKVEQERDQREQVSDNALKEVERLQKSTASLESENEELIGQISILQLDSNADKLYKELLDKMKAKEIQHQEEFYKMSILVDSLKSRLAAVTQEKDNLEAVNNEKIKALQINLESIKQQLLKKQRLSDDTSSISSKTSKSYLKQTVVELEESVDAIKSQYENKVRSLQHALDSARKKIEKYERKISDLTNLLEENASVVDVLHTKLKMKGKQRPQAQRQRARSPFRSPESEESEVSY